MKCISSVPRWWRGGRLVRTKDESSARVSRQAIEAKLPYALKFLASSDDDVSGTIAPFAHDYVTLLKQTPLLDDRQKEFVKVRFFFAGKFRNVDKSEFKDWRGTVREKVQVGERLWGLS